MCDQDSGGVGGKHGSITVALMSREPLDETLCIAEVIQIGRFILTMTLIRPNFVFIYFTRIV